MKKTNKTMTLIALCLIFLLIFGLDEIFSQKQRVSGELIFGTKDIGSTVNWRIKWRADSIYRWWSDYKLTSQYYSGESNPLTGPGDEKYALNSPPDPGKIDIAWGKYEFSFEFYFPGGTVTKHFYLDLIDGNWTSGSPYQPPPVDTRFRWNDSSGVFQYYLNGTSESWTNFDNGASKKIWKLWDENSSPNQTVFQPTKPNNFRCTNPNSKGEHPHFTWTGPDWPGVRSLTVYYRIFRNNSEVDYGLTSESCTDEDVGIHPGGNQLTYYVKAYLSDSPDSDPSNSVSINGYFSKQLPNEPERGESEKEKESAIISVYPNPFNPETQISYNLPRESRVTLSVYNIAGQKVATLVAGRQSAGTHTAIFDGKSLPAGVYLVRLQSGRKNHLQKVLLVK